MERFDLAVLGGGPGGYVAAIRAAKLGLKTVLVEKDAMGGACLNRGCIPTKCLLQSAQVYRTVLQAAQFGVFVGDSGFDFTHIAARKDQVVSRLRGGVEALLKAAKVDIVRGRGVLEPDKVIAAGDKRIAADKIIVATGSAPAVIPVPGVDLPGVMTSDGVLSLTAIPRSVVIVGGGVIGMEFAALFSSLGVSVTVVEVMPTILTGMDADVISTMNGVFKKMGVSVHTSSKVVEISGKDMLTVSFHEDGQAKSVAGEIVVMATGRKAVTDGLESSGLAMERGCVVVDEHMRTNIPDVYAIGDCTGKIQLAHVASAQGIVAAQNAAGGNKTMRYDIVPACVYTNPEIACVGLTEAAARATGQSVTTGSFPVAANGKSMIMGETEGFCKLVVNTDSGEILGAHIVGPHGTDLIAELAAVMRAEGTIEELADTIHPHPTVSEIVMESAHDVEGLCGHKI